MVLKLVSHVSKQHTGSTTQILLNSTGLPQILVVSQCLAYAIPSKAQTGADKARLRFARHLQTPIEAKSDKSRCFTFVSSRITTFYRRFSYLRYICSFDENENRSISIC